MKVLEIKGQNELNGTIKISGAKNSAVALIPATILSDEQTTIYNVPDITDIEALSDILEYLGAKVTRDEETIKIDSKNIENKTISEEHSTKLRASYYFLGALLGKYKKAEMYFPGGCSIGERPINLHLKGFEALGAKVTANKNCYKIEAEELIGTRIYLDIASVGATINIMLAATKAKGKTVIDNAAKEPEIVNVATLLNSMGAKIKGAGTSSITIEGVEQLHGCFHEVIPDRIEAGTYIIAGALCGKNLRVENIIPKHIESLTSKLKDMNVPIEIGNDYVVVSSVEKYLPTKIKTLIYPGFPTDLQQPLTILMTQAEGVSKVEETIWENRFMHIPYLNKMGCNIEVKDDTAIIHGKTPLKGTDIKATDLRAGAAMVLAGLIAEGTTTIENVDHILRGYEKIVEKLTNVGANIELKEI